MARRGTTRSASGASTPGGRTKASSRSRTSAKRTAGGSKGGGGKPSRRGGVEAKTVAEFRDALRKNLIRPRDMVMLTRQRIEEVLGDAVERGVITTKDAQSIGSNLLKRGRSETNAVLRDLEGLLGRAGAAAQDVNKQASGARGRAVRAASPALQTADRARRAAAVGRNFPITGYNDLSATQIRGRLGDLTPAQLRKVRDHERRNANRKTILSAIEARLR
jgi:polyhydroxyalkanoate synthesis regulator phasin